MAHVKHFEVNKQGKDHVVGDIHGCFGLLEEKLKEISFNELTDRLFSVGDLVDRGEQSEACIEWLNKPWFHAVRGNHEQMAIDYVAGEYPRDWYIRNGGAWFLGMPENEQKCFAMMFSDLPIAIDVQTKNGLIGIVHAECPIEDWSKLEEKLSGERADLFKEVCLWDRFRFKHNVTTNIEGVHTVIVGHTPTNEPSYRGNVLYIDTGAVFCGELTIKQI